MEFMLSSYCDEHRQNPRMECGHLGGPRWQSREAIAPLHDGVLCHGHPLQAETAGADASRHHSMCTLPNSCNVIGFIKEQVIIPRLVPRYSASVYGEFLASRAGRVTSVA